MKVWNIVPVSKCRSFFAPKNGTDLLYSILPGCIYSSFIFLLAVGVEPTRTEVHQILSLARLPISSRQLAQT
jgi:hypothetical protein